MAFLKRTWLRAMGAAATWLACAAAGPASAQSVSLEYAVKANYLYKFGPFVEWPPRAFTDAQAPFTVCLVGHDALEANLAVAVRGQTVNGRSVAVRRVAALEAVAGCHVLYIGPSRGLSPAEVLKAVRGSPILTVTDESAGVAGGILHFVVRGGRVRFMLNMPGARANGLAISSKLQALAIPRSSD